MKGKFLYSKELIWLLAQQSELTYCLINISVPVVCSEGTRQCPDGSNCYTPCDGNEECDNGFDETECGKYFSLVRYFSNVLVDFLICG